MVGFLGGTTRDLQRRVKFGHRGCNQEGGVLDSRERERDRRSDASGETQNGNNSRGTHYFKCRKSL